MEKVKKFKRATAISNLYDTKHEVFELTGAWKSVLGDPSKSGAWLIYGAEKNGKTWLALMLANYLSSFTKVHYISGEEGKDKAFVDSCVRAGIKPNNRSLLITDYEPIEDLNARLKSRVAPKVVFIDNLTIYADELTSSLFRKLLTDHPKTLFIFLAHEDRGAPYTAVAKLCKKLAKIIFYVQGLIGIVSGRCPGGKLIINDEQAALYHGQSTNDQE